MDNGRDRDTVSAMRAQSWFLLAAVATSLVVGCLPNRDEDPKWRQPPKSWDPKGDDLTFGTKNLDAFNSMTEDERAAFVEQLKGQPGTFKGQAQFQRSSEIAENLAEYEYGKYEVFATVTEPVLFEIAIDYYLYSPEEIGDGIPPGTHVEFTGTLTEISYQSSSKPRKLEVKVKDALLTRLKD
jgi:hypothetical protein